MGAGAEGRASSLDAPDAVERRRIIGRRWKGIVTHCNAVIDSVHHPDLQESRGFALDCVAALRDGHNNPAQALAANLLDSLMRAHFDDPARKKLTFNKKSKAKFDLNDYTIRVARPPSRPPRARPAARRWQNPVRSAPPASYTRHDTGTSEGRGPCGSASPSSSPRPVTR
ncbi:putative protein OS=Streptomyces fumanus OX=67302 GN=GCM10018772_58440 PE=4 SV=1 [Streptomyces fumanus]